jgi:hypothetical protein
MWIGKFAIISYLFAIALLGVGFMFATILDVSLFTGGTQGDIDTIIGRHDISGTETNPTLIFGDFIAGARAIGDIVVNTLSGGVVADVIPQAVNGIANGDYGLYITIRLFLTFSTACLIINFITGREI